MATAKLATSSRFGQEIWSETRGLEAGNNWPQFSVQRGELQMALLRAVHERLGRGAMLRVGPSIALRASTDAGRYSEG